MATITSSKSAPVRLFSAYKEKRYTTNWFFHSGVECASIGDFNTFEPRARVAANMRIADWCTVGAACILSPTSSSDNSTRCTTVPASGNDLPSIDEAGEEIPTVSDACETLPSETTVFGKDSQRRRWSGENKNQAMDLHRKHLDSLQEASANI